MRAICIAGAALLLAAACGDEDGASNQYTSSVEKHSTSADDIAVAPAPAVPVDTAPDAPPPQVAFAITLAPLPGNALRGTGQVAAAGKETAVSVTLEQGKPGTTYAGSIRRGVCSALGADVGSLNPVSVAGQGRGAASSSVSVPIDSLAAAPHVVVYGPGGRPETCADIGAGARLAMP